MGEAQASAWRRWVIGELSWRRWAISGSLIYLASGTYLYAMADGMIFLPQPPSYGPESVKPLPAKSLASLAQLSPWADRAISPSALASWLAPPPAAPEVGASGPGLVPPPEGRYRLPWRSGGPGTVVHWLPHPKARYTLLYSHGNAEDLGQVLPLLQELRALGLSILTHDYPGYGQSDGRPNRWNASASAGRAYALLRAWGLPPERLILHGRSVGGGPTIELAQAWPARALILESTFMSVQRVRFPWRIFPFDAFDSAAGVAKLRWPTLVIHGTQDELIPFAQGQGLYAAAAGPKRHLWVEGAGHDDVAMVAGPRWALAIARFVADLDRGLGPDGPAL